MKKGALSHFQILIRCFGQKKTVNERFREITWAKFKTSLSSVWSLCLWLKIHDKDSLSWKFWISHIPNLEACFYLFAVCSKSVSFFDTKVKLRYSHFGFSLSSSRSKAQWPSRTVDPSSRRSNLRKFFLFHQGQNENYRELS